MDSLLSNAQRCARKADSLVKLGLYDEAMAQLDKSIVYLNELKSNTSRYENIQMLNVQIDSIDRKKRSVAIKRSECNKKKNRIENLINKSRGEGRSTIRGHIQSLDHSPVIVDLDELMLKPTNFTKLDKDRGLIIEELSTTNAEYKKVNTFLINEIEQLKKENDFLKVELIKMHMSESLNGEVSGFGDKNEISEEAENSYALSSTPKPDTNKSNVLKSKILNANDITFMDDKKSKNSKKQVSTSSSSSSMSQSSSSWSASSSSQTSTEQKFTPQISTRTNSTQKTNQTINNLKPQQHICRAIDLSKYLENDDDDDLLVNKPVNFNMKTQHYGVDTDDECDEFKTHNLPPQEFTID